MLKVLSFSKELNKGAFVEKVIEGLLNGNTSLITLVFGFLLTYFVWDVIKKINKVDDVDDHLKQINTLITAIKSSLDSQNTLVINIKQDVDELKVFSRELSHRVVKLEVLQQLDNIKDGNERN
jgi:cAMP phosphodiesterase